MTEKDIYWLFVSSDIKFKSFFYVVVPGESVILFLISNTRCEGVDKQETNISILHRIFHCSLKKQPSEFCNLPYGIRYMTIRWDWVYGHTNKAADTTCSNRHNKRGNKTNGQ